MGQGRSTCVLTTFPGIPYLPQLSETWSIFDQLLVIVAGFDVLEGGTLSQGRLTGRYVKILKKGVVTGKAFTGPGNTAWLNSWRWYYEGTIDRYTVNLNQLARGLGGL